jgi:hypothetical protein
MNQEDHQLPVWVRRADGTVFDGTAPASLHRRMHIELLHSRSPGFIEITPGSRPPGDSVAIDRRKEPRHYLLGGAAGEEDWLDTALEHAAQIMRGEYQHERRHFTPPREEVFVAPSSYNEQHATRDTVIGTHCLWVDVDGDVTVDETYREPFRALLERKPPHLIVESAGSGGRHAYWLLADLLPGAVTGTDGAVDAPIERANRRLLAELGVRVDNPDETIGDTACANRTRVMRLAGTRNWKTGGWSRLCGVDLALPLYTLDALVGDLPDPTPPPSRPRAIIPAGDRSDFDRWLHDLDPAAYFWDLAGVTVPVDGKVRCPFPDHEDPGPSCHVYGPGGGFHCFGCNRGGQSAIDLASALRGGPTNRLLKGDEFLAAKQIVCERYGWPGPARRA